MLKLAFFACAVFLLASCNKVPKYAKMIPDDAAVVLRMDVRKISDKSKLGDNQDVKDKIEKAIKDADMGHSAREKLEDILDDPTKSGVDFRDPLMLYYTEDGDDRTVGILGSIKSKEDFTDLLNTLAKEADKDGVEDAKKDFSYLANDGSGIFYNDDFFLITQLPYDESKQDDKIDDIKKQFEDTDDKNTMASSEDMKAMCKKDGLMQLLVEGEGIGNMREFKDADDDMPDGLKLKDFAYLMDLNTDAGEATITGEVMAKSDEWKDYISSYDDAYGNIGNSLLKYVSTDGAAVLANLNGDKVSELMKKFGYDKTIKKFFGKDTDTFYKVLRSINGDVAFAFNGYDIEKTPSYSDFPLFEGGIYATTQDNSVANDLQKEMKGDSHFIKAGTDRYAIPILGNIGSRMGSTTSEEGDASLYMNFGYTSGVTYIAFSSKKDNIPEAKSPLSESLVKGKQAYVYIGSGLLEPISKFLGKNKDNLNSEQSLGLKVINGIIDQVAFVEGYYEAGGKTTIRLVMKDSKVDPLKAAVDGLTDLSDLVKKAEEEVSSAPDDYAIADSAAVDSAAGGYEYDDYGSSDYDDDYATADSAYDYNESDPDVEDYN